MGAVKSRLARDIGWVRATSFYRRTLDLVAKRLGADPRWCTLLCVTPDASSTECAWPYGIAKFPQGGGDLGDRLARVMTVMPPGPVVIVGSDIPSIGRAQIAQAFAELGGNDAVLGPGSDGGYWLVGLRRSPRITSPFGGVRWSSEHTLDDTLANLEGARVGLTTELTDVDNEATHRRLAAKTARLVLPAARRST